MNLSFHQKANKNSTNLYKIKNQIHEKAEQLRRQRGDHNNSSFVHSSKMKDDKIFRCFPTDVLYAFSETENNYGTKWG